MTMESPPSQDPFSSLLSSTETNKSWLPLVYTVFFFVVIIYICTKGDQTPTESTPETHENSLPQPQDIETGHLTQPLPLPQEDMKTGCMTRINQLSIETSILEFKDTKKEGFDEICCPICLEEFEDGHEIIRINKCRHVFHPFCIDSWLTESGSCPNCRCSLNARHRKEEREIE
ncbi:unnamed protein product [Microthlaspi erraticum]|uniref:RING-type E3 ubiquitin transferase n=1 Tax=Microthlaspi erraticum TaxID=1685480 RepID=A0A6D2KXY5_9BRAS|nr:unnamed protein product [Microthlaspi erraticum]